MRGLQTLLKAADTDGALEIDAMEGGANHPEVWLAAAGTFPFLSERRTVVVRHLLRAGTAEDAHSDLASALKALPETALLVLVADEESGDERKNARIRATWDKVVRGAKGYVEEFKVNPKSLRASLKAEVLKSGKTVSDRSIDVLLEMTGESSSRAVEELEKVLLYTGDGDAVTEANIQAVVMPSREWNVYKMVDAALAGEVGRSMHQLRVLVGSNAKAEGAAFQFLLPTLARQLRLVWQARLCVEAGVSPGTAPEAITARFPSNPNLQKMQPWSQDQSLRLARKLTLPQIAAAFRATSDADARLKGLLSGFSSMETLERMLLEITEAVTPA